ncbi:MAG: hypothetical protein QXY78_05120 [Thermoplasmata archaeon]
MNIKNILIIFLIFSLLFSNFSFSQEEIGVRGKIDINFVSVILYYFVVIIGISLIGIGVGLLVYKIFKGKEAKIRTRTPIIFIASGVFLLLINILVIPLLNNIIFINFAPGGFLIVITAGVLYFLGQLATRDNNDKLAVTLFNLSALTVFFGTIIVEMLIFAQYVQIKTIPLKECSEEVRPSELHRFLSCVLLGYDLGNQPTWAWASYIIFGFLIPFSVMATMVYSLFYGAGLDMVFGGGRRAQITLIVLSIATAAFGAKQLIGAFLIDLLAYGVWGIFGLIIAFLLSNFVRMVGMRFLIVKQQVYESIYGEFRATEYEFIVECEEKIELYSKNLNSPRPINKNILLAWLKECESYKELIDIKLEKIKYRDPQLEGRLLACRDRLNEIIPQIKKRLESLEKGGQSQASSS